MGTEPTIAEIVREALDSRLLDLQVALPGRIESYDASTQTADVLPMVRRAIADIAGDIQHEELPKIPNVPVQFPRSSSFSMTWPLAKGDFVLLVFCSSAIGNWRETGDVADPGDLRRHDLSYPVAIPGIAPKGQTVPTASDAAVIEVTAPATHLTVGSGASDFVALDNLVRQRIGEFSGAYCTAAAVPNDGGAAIQTAVKGALAAWGGGFNQPPAVAATKLKAE